MKLTGTYVKFLVNDGPYSGKYLMYLKRRTGSNQMKLSQIIYQ